MTWIETLVNGVFNGCGSAIGSYVAVTYAIKHIDNGVKKTQQIIKKVNE